MINIDFQNISRKLKKITCSYEQGIVTKVIGLTIEVSGIRASVGELCHIHNNEDSIISCEVVGFKDNDLMLMPLGELQGIGPGCAVYPQKIGISVKCSEALLGRVLDGLGNPLDGAEIGDEFTYYNLDNSPPDPMKRSKIKEIVPTGLKAIDSMLTCGRGQRIGIFAGSGVGKSTTLGMIARGAEADVNVIALIGERGREVKEFLENDLGEEGMKKSIIVCATSDQPALVRLKGAFTATAIAEYFRDKGKNVILMMDSVTRFAMAQREVGLAIGEPPASKGYTPSVFAMLPRLMERSGNSDKGSITAFYTVLVDGGDMDEPIADTTRGILDGHIILSRKMASKNHYPAIDVLESVSRLMTHIVTKEQLELASWLRDVMAVYRESEDLINIGAYTVGSNPKIDLAIEKIDLINGFLKQGILEKITYEDMLLKLREIRMN